MSRRYVLVALACLAAAAFLVQMMPEGSALPTIATGVETGGAAPSPYKYRWVDSTATGCKAPSLIGSGIPPPGSPLLPAPGCPLGWDEIANVDNVNSKLWVYYDNYYPVYSYDASTYAYPYMSYYGGIYYDYSWNVNENGFIDMGGYGTYYCSDSRIPQQLPSIYSGGGCSSSGSGKPGNVIAGFWTNMQANVYLYGYFYGGPGTCWDEPPAPAGFPSGEYPGQVWYSTYTEGTAPNQYVVIEYDRVLVNPGDGGCNPSPTPNHYATFEYKMYADPLSNVDVIYQSTDNNGQQVSMGIDNAVTSAGSTAGLDYCWSSCAPSGAGDQCPPAGSNLVCMSDRAVRYYLNHAPVANTGTALVNEDCLPVTGCAAGNPANFGFDPDYADVGTEYYAMTCTPSTTHGSFATGCNPGTCGFGYAPCGAYAPYLNFNGLATYTYTVTDSSGSAGPATVTLTVNPVNDKPTAADRTYGVVAGDWLYVIPSQGVINFPATPALDPEIAPQRNTWGTSPPSGPPSGMAEGTPAQHLVAIHDAASCGYAGPGWDPSPGALSDFNIDGSFTYTPPPSFTGTDSFKFCVADVDDASAAVLSYSAVYTVFLNVNPGGPLIAKTDLLTINEDASLSAVGALAPAANDVITGSGVTYNLIPGTGPTNAVPGSFVWTASTGSFTYTPLADWSGTDGFQYQITSSAGSSNVGAVKIVVNPINDQPLYTTFFAGGDTIAEDGGCSGVCAPFVKSVTNFLTGVKPGGGADELTQTLRLVIVSQSNPGILSSTVPWPDNYDFNVLSAPTPVPGPSLVVSGPAGNQVVTLSYATVPDANGVDTVCFRLMDNGGTSFGSKDKNPWPPLDPLCFDITLTPVPDAPVAVPDVFTMYKDHELFAPAPAITMPFYVAPVTNLFSDHGAGVDYDADGELFQSYVASLPGVGALEGNKVNLDGSFHYTPPAGFFGTTTFTYKLKDSASVMGLPATVTINVLDNTPPTASFTASTYSAISGEAISFISVCSDNSAIKLWYWDFGDGQTSTETSPTHVYTVPGDYTVKLTCFDDNGDASSVMKTIHVGLGTDRAPQSSLADQFGLGLVAFAGENQNVPEGATVKLHGTVNGVYSGAEIRYAWSQVSGRPVVLSDATSSDPSFTAPVFAGVGPEAILIGLVASDGVAQSLPSLVQINVHSTNEPPVADAGADQDIIQGMVATLDGSGSSDADKDTLSYEWTQLAGQPVEISDLHAAAPTFEVPAYDGTPMIFQLVVSDGDARGSATTRVLALPPDAAANGFTYDMVRTAKGAHVSFHTPMKAASFVWDFGDGTGTSTEAQPSYDYTRPGTYVVKMSIIDEAGAVQAYSRPITVGTEAARNVASPVQHESPAAGAMVAFALLGCALVALRRR